MFIQSTNLTLVTCLDTSMLHLTATKITVKCSVLHLMLCYIHGSSPLIPSLKRAAASSLGRAVSCRAEGRAIDTALGQCFIPNSSH